VKKSEIEAMEWCIQQAQAVDRAFVANINKCVATAEKSFTDAGVSPKRARKLAETAVARALYDMQTDLGGW
jgi:hypothetical protein